MSKKKVLGVGAAILDVLVNVEDSFIDGIDGEKGGMNLVSSDELDAMIEKTGKKTTLAPGGSAANTIFGLTKLNQPTAIFGMAGNDLDGEFYIEQYRNRGGDSSYIYKTDSAHTARCLSLVTPDSQRTMRTDLGAAACLSSDFISDAMFAGISHVHFEGYTFFAGDLLETSLKAAKIAGCTTSLDLASFEVVNAVKDILPTILEKYIDIVFANEDEAKALCDTEDADKQLEYLSKFCDVAVVKLGKDGAIIKRGNEIETVDAEIVDAIDTTGAGDLWQAGFLYGYLNDKSLAETGAIASMLGAAVVQVMGATIPEKAWEEIKERING